MTIEIETKVQCILDIDLVIYDEKVLSMDELYKRLREEPYLILEEIGNLVETGRLTFELKEIKEDDS